METLRDLAIPPSPMFDGSLSALDACKILMSQGSAYVIAANESKVVTLTAESLCHSLLSDDGSGSSPSAISSISHAHELRLPADLYVLDALKEFSAAGASFALVTQNNTFEDRPDEEPRNTFVGVVDIYTCIKACLDALREEWSTECGMMLEDVLASREKSPVLPALQSMRRAYKTLIDRGADAALVLDRLNLKGVFSYRDIMASLVHGANPNVATVSSVMSKDLTVVAPSMSVIDAFELVTQVRKDPIVVSDGNVPLGLISALDLLRCVFPPSDLENGHSSEGELSTGTAESTDISPESSSDHRITQHDSNSDSDSDHFMEALSPSSNIIRVPLLSSSRLSMSASVNSFHTASENYRSVARTVSMSSTNSVTSTTSFATARSSFSTPPKPTRHSLPLRSIDTATNQSLSRPLIAHVAAGNPLIPPPRQDSVSPPLRESLSPQPQPASLSRSQSQSSRRSLPMSNSTMQRSDSQTSLPVAGPTARDSRLSVKLVVMASAESASQVLQRFTVEKDVTYAELLHACTMRVGSNDNSVPEGRVCLTVETNAGGWIELTDDDSVRTAVAEATAKMHENTAIEPKMNLRLWVVQDAEEGSVRDPEGSGIGWIEFGSGRFWTLAVFISAGAAGVAILASNAFSRLRRN